MSGARRTRDTRRRTVHRCRQESRSRPSAERRSCSHPRGGRGRGYEAAAVLVTCTLASLGQRTEPLGRPTAIGPRSARRRALKYHRLVDSRRVRRVVTPRRAAILVPVITAAFALTLAADGVSPDRSTAVAPSSASPNCPGTLQSLIDATPTGGTLTAPPCVYRETVTISRPMVINGYGAVIDGRDTDGNVVRRQWMLVGASDVTVRGFAMRYANNDYSIGAVETAQAGVRRFRLEDCDVSYAFIDINLAGTTDSEIRGCAIHHARHLGIRVSAPTVHGAHGNRIIGNRIYHNNRVGEPDPNVDAGGLKASGQDDLVLDGNIVYDNGGMGLWLDVSCFNATVSNNKVHDNDAAGIV